MDSILGTNMMQETGKEIGEKIIIVLDVDVPEKGVQWGKYLHVPRKSWLGEKR